MERLTLLEPATPREEWAQIAGALLVATDVYHTVSRKPVFDLASEVRASIANARNHGLLRLENLDWHSGLAGDNEEEQRLIEGRDIFVTRAALGDEDPALLCVPGAPSQDADSQPSTPRIPQASDWWDDLGLMISGR